MNNPQPALSHLRLRMAHGPDDAFDGAKQNLPITKHLNALPSSERFPSSPFLILPGASAGEKLKHDFGRDATVLTM